ncbi:MAG: primosomal protein N', partial [Rhizobiales bacterium]|nr:primosomal protein N' [Hyphomicrobiales bacterium]
MSNLCVDVLLPLGLDTPYSYAVPDGLVLKPGDLVHVPLGNRGMVGCVWPGGGARAVDTAKLKSVKAKLDFEPLPPDLIKLIDWMADYTLAPKGMVLRMALRHGESPGPQRERVGVRAVGREPGRMTAARAKLMALLADGFVRGKGEAAREAGVSPSVVDGLVDEGVLETVVLPPEPAAERPDPTHSIPSL